MIEKPKAMLGGSELSPRELERIKSELEFFDQVEHVSEEMRELIETQWPDLVCKLPPKWLPVRSARRSGTMRRRA
jgi:hypothetical protein